MTITLRLLAAVAALQCVASLGQELPPTRFVAVDGVRMRVRTDEPARPVQGAPTVVFESGGSAPLETWDSILPAIARATAVLAYDRVGTGQSEWDGLAPTPARAVARLLQLLEQLELEPPYVLVGHSWGGALVRSFATEHADLLAGVVYVDPQDITLTHAAMTSLFESFGATSADYETFVDTMEQSMRDAPPSLAAEARVSLSLLGSDGDLWRRPVPANVPAVVLVASAVGMPPQGSMPFDVRAYAHAMQQSRVTRLRSWAGERGTFEVVAGSGHMIHVQRPDVVIAAIRNLLNVGVHNE
jgi:pimeloyl-ACP methyl ester carboxylesterase